MSSLRTLSAAYSIGQLRRLFGVTARALRFYEQIGLVKPNRDGQNRVYSRGDYQRIRVITSARKAGLTLEQIRELLDIYSPADGGAAQIGKAIGRLRQRVTDLEAQRDYAALTLAELEFRLERVPTRPEVAAKGAFIRLPATDELSHPEAR